MMRSFDAFLRGALIEANLVQYQSVLENADSTEPDFSPRYRRERTRLLSDPVGWVRRRGRPLWKRVMRNVACILLACSLALGGLMAVSPTVRAAVLNWLREITGNIITYYSAGQTEEETLPYHWRITWLPEGWVLQEASTFGWRYQEENGPGQVFFDCYVPGDSRLTTNVGDTTDAEGVRSTIQVQDYNADYYESDRYRVLLWENEDRFLFMLRSNTTVSHETFLKIAESITFYDGRDIAYTADWVPQEYEPVYRDELIGAVQEMWTYNQKSLIWQYVTDPICPFEVPEGTPEIVAVGDLEGQFWAADEPPDNESDSTITVNGEPVEQNGSTYVGDGYTIIVSGTLDTKKAAVLLWTDPDTNTTFRLEGALDKSELLHMAQSVVETQPQPTPPSHNKKTTAGTAYAE